MDEVRKAWLARCCVLRLSALVMRELKGLISFFLSLVVRQHPGGDEVLISEAGRDATDAFEDVGHSDDARALLKDMLKGDMEGAVSVARF